MFERCPVCLTTTEKPTKVQRSHASTKRALEAVSIDHFGPLPDNSHILVVRCDLSRFPVAVFVRTTTTSETVAALTPGQWAGAESCRNVNGLPLATLDIHGTTTFFSTSHKAKSVQSWLLEAVPHFWSPQM